MSDFRDFREYLIEFLIFFHEIVFGRKILSITCDKQYTFDFWCCSYPGNEAQSPNFGRILTICGIFRAISFSTSF